MCCCVWCFLCCPLSNILLCWTFSFGKCDAEHFPLENVMLNIFLWKMWCWTFSFGKCTRCKNAFWHQMHLMQKCIFATHQMHFCTAEHFPLENVRWTFSFGKCTPKCIYGIKCILASNAFVTFCDALPKCICNILCCWTFSFGKCSIAEHFPLENVMLNILQSKMYALQKCICNILCNKMYASNAFDAYILLHKMYTNAFLHSWTFSFGKCSAPAKCKGTAKAEKRCVFCFAKNKDVCFLLCKNTFLHQIHFCIKCIFALHLFFACAKNTAASNTFLHQIDLMHKMYLMPKCIWCCTFCWCWTFSKGKCTAPTKCKGASNAFVQNAFDAKMHFG